ncbi:glycoside hydrolase family 5 protein [Rutstroemia sp. NJR-2017a BBW]|nr:glycoside hydrolase family 5 protein [Rutstroemia sp. NJR-2017a BBW]
MLLSTILLGATALSGVFGIPAPAAEPEPKTSISVVEKRKNFWFAGVNESGAEFGSGNIPGTKGTDYTWPLTSSVDTLMGKGFNIFRIPFLIRGLTIVRERLVPSTLYSGVNSAYLADMKTGNSYTGAWTWVSSGTSTAMGALTDPNNNIIYEMHQYLDSDGSGTSSTCVSTTIGKERLAAATAWLKNNGKNGILGETAAGSNSVCISAITGMLEYMKENNDVWRGWLLWGGGPWWGSYMFSVEPPSGTQYTGVVPSVLQYI